MATTLTRHTAECWQLTVEHDTEENTHSAHIAALPEHRKHLLVDLDVIHYSGNTRPPTVEAITKKTLSVDIEELYENIHAARNAARTFQPIIDKLDLA